MPFLPESWFAEMCIRDRERSGDHITNIAEEIVFFIDAKVLKHSGRTDEHYADCLLYTSVRAFQANFLSGSHAEIFLRSIFHEVVALHPKFAAEFDDVVAFFGMLGVVDGFHLFHLPLSLIHISFSA